MSVDVTPDEILIGAALTGAPIHDYLDEGGLDASAFDEPTQNRIWTILQDYFQESSNTPDVELLYDLAKTSFPDHARDITAYAKRAVNTVEGRQFDIDKIDHYVQRLQDIHGEIELRRKLGRAIDVFDNQGREAALQYIQSSVTIDVIDNQSNIKTADILDEFEQFEHDVIERKENPELEKSIPLGIAPLDNIFSGLMGGELMVFAAIPGGGKSVSLIDVAISCAEMGHKVHFFTIEMGLVQTVYRGYSRMTRISTKHFRKADRITDSELESWRAAVNKMRQIKNAGVKITSIPEHSSTRYMRAELARLKRKEGWEPDLILVDYAGIMRPSGDWQYKNESDWAYVGQNTKDLKNWAIADDKPIISAVQLLPDAIGKDTLTFKDLGLSKILISANCDIIVAFIPLAPEELEFAEVLNQRAQILKAREGTETDEGKRIMFVDLTPDFKFIRIHTPSDYVP